MSASASTPPRTGYAGEEPTHAPPWHGLVVWDVFFNALAAGLFLTASVGELVRPGAFVPVGTWAYPLALVLLLTDLTLLVLDLGDPLRFHHMLRVFKPSSPMSFGTWCLALYSLPLTAVVVVDVLVLIGAFPADSSALGVVRKLLLAAGLPFAFGSMAYKGVLFSTSAQPGWKDARWLGAYHVASAFALGAAVLLAIASLAEHAPAVRILRPAVAVLLVAQLVPLILLARELRRALTAAHTSGELRAAAGVVFSVGIVVPLPLLLLEGTAPHVLAALAALAGGWFVRRVVVHLPHHAPDAKRAAPIRSPGTGATR
jgi:hypothetical protein